MRIEISRKTATRLAAEAKRRGISLAALLEGLIDEHVCVTRSIRSEQALPVWHLGGAGALHRRDIYADAE